MIKKLKCINCKHFNEKEDRCYKVIGFNATAADKCFYSGNIYALPNEENKNGDCKYYDFSKFKYILNKFL